MSSYNSSNNQPTFNPYVNGGGLGTPSNGFASRGKGNHIKRLSVAPPANINSIHEDEIDSNPAPRTSRSHLLAGLRTAPRSSNGVPASAPYNQQQFGLDASQYASRNNSNGFRASQNMPQTAAAPNFSGLAYNPYANGYGQQKHMFAYADQILAPPSFAEEGDDSVDPQVYAELMATNMRLMQRQQQLQEQLRNVTAAAQQFQGLKIAGQQQQHQQQQQQQYHNHPLSPSTSYYSQQMQNGLQPIVTPVPNQPGVLSVYNPMTGQQNFILDPSYQELSASPPASTPGLVNSSPDSEGPAIYRRDNMSPPSAAANNHNRRNMFSPPAKSPSPPRGEVEPLPQPSANAFRPGHRKALSVAQSNGRDSSRLNGPKSAGFPATPMTGTFGPGMARAGEHPVRQPRGPPPLEELVAKPTTKHEGSKNFATRQRRRAVFNLVKAGHERRTGRSGSADASSPASDAENGILANSDADVESNGSLSGHSSTGSLRSVATGAIGSEIKKRREERRSNAGSFSSEDGTSNEERKRSGLFALTSQAEKRKSAF